MRCEDMGTLRAYLDGELPEQRGGRLQHHLANCARCRDELHRLRTTAILVAQGMAALGDVPATARVPEAHVLASVLSRRGNPAARGRRLNSTFGGFSMFFRKLVRQHRLALAGTLAMLAFILIGLTPQGQAAASNFLAQFRAQKLKVVTVDPSEVSKVIYDLSQLGLVDASQLRGMNPSPVASVAEASQRAGFPVKQPRSLPSGVPTEPVVAVKAASTLSFTFDIAKAKAHLAKIGETGFSVPAKFDGAKLSLHVPSAVLLVYGQSSTKPLLVGQAGAPSGEVSGNVTLSEMRDLLLRMPGLSPTTAAQLTAMDDWANTLPIPVPKDRAKWQEREVDGVKVLVVSDVSALGGFVIWQKDSFIYGIGGPFGEQELLNVARSLK
ncbi:MAG: zf-HC2 domain-containing protein [Chloroflexi bacterium]|nr:zf-HC2 domain-containing protein [Chloroflexota bacterium]